MGGRSGFGNVRRLPSGRYQARYFGPDMTYHRGPTTFQTKGDAQAWLAGERRLISLERWSSPSERASQVANAEKARKARTLAAYADSWLSGRVTSAGSALRPSTQAGYRNALNVHILPPFGELPLDEITGTAVRQWRGRFAAQGRDAAGAKAYALLKAILQTAEDDGLITRNPCRLKGAGHAARKRESVALSPSELAALADAMPDKWRALTLVSGWCGLRIGEAAGLRFGDVGLEKGVLRIVQSAQYLGSPPTLVLGPPKSARGARVVHMPTHVTAALAEHLATQESWRQKDFVWTRTDGQPISRHTVLAAFKRAAAAVGFEGMVWHDLRHTANTLAADAGASQATLQTRMGHADPKVSAIYLHTSRSHDRELAAALTRMATEGDTESPRSERPQAPR
ncbi:MAG TPA: tyrosine-type recombinase/integrase [Dermatophilaceae bacterium]|nr:tyrosine-type recombinase/integrase [Dermatophilaceae bacterium]